MPTRLDLALGRIQTLLQETSTWSQGDLRRLLAAHREEWRLPLSMTEEAFLTGLLKRQVLYPIT